MVFLSKSYVFKHKYAYVQHSSAEGGSRTQMAYSITDRKRPSAGELTNLFKLDQAGQ